MISKTFSMLSLVACRKNHHQELINFKSNFIHINLSWNCHSIDVRLTRSVNSIRRNPSRSIEAGVFFTEMWLLVKIVRCWSSHNCGKCCSISSGKHFLSTRQGLPSYAWSDQWEGTPPTNLGLFHCRKLPS